MWARPDWAASVPCSPSRPAQRRWHRRSPRACSLARSSSAAACALRTSRARRISKLFKATLRWVCPLLSLNLYLLYMLHLLVPAKSGTSELRRGLWHRHVIIGAVSAFGPVYFFFPLSLYRTACNIRWIVGTTGHLQCAINSIHILSGQRYCSTLTTTPSDAAPPLSCSRPCAVL